MADKELRRMNRTELIEIIYALEQNEQKLQGENDKLTADLDDRKIRLEQSGSIAEAALSLNHIFEDAQAAADQYLMSLQSTEEEAEDPEKAEEDETEDVNAEAERILEDARQQEQGILEEARRQADQVVDEAQKQADQVVEDARKQADEITDEARRQADEIMEEAREKADEYRAAVSESADADVAWELEQAKEQCEKERQAVQEYHDKFMKDMSDILKDNPELLERVRQMGSAEGV